MRRIFLVDRSLWAALQGRNEDRELPRRPAPVARSSLGRQRHANEGGNKKLKRSTQYCTINLDCTALLIKPSFLAAFSIADESFSDRAAICGLRTSEHGA
ncbi:unnamed protein product, partial [Iphiclides podalirius]